MATSSEEHGDVDSLPRNQLRDAEESFQTAFRREYPLIWLGTLVGPLISSVAILTVLGIAYGGTYVQNLVWTALGTFLLAGRFVILLGMSGESPDVGGFFSSGQLDQPAWQLALMVFYMDLMVASLLVFHAGFMYRLPFLGERFSQLVEDGQFILKSQPWMKRATFIGLVAFVMFPLAATGSVGGAIFGRLLGMSRLAAFVGILLGSLLGCSLMYFGAELINTYLNPQDPLVRIGGLLAIAAIILLLNVRYRHIKSLDRNDSHARQRTSDE
jgi:uncharacterized membrane protein